MSEQTNWMPSDNGLPISVKNCSKFSTVRSLPIHSSRVQPCYADRLDQAEMATFEAPGHHIFDYVADLVPAGAERDGSFLPGQFARPAGEKQHVDLGELVLADCPRQFLNAH